MKRNCTLLMVIASLMGMISCNVIEPDNPNGEKEIIMLLNGEVNGYDNVLTKASNDSINNWKEGDMLYLTFKNSGEIVPGTAIYSKTKGWVINNLEISMVPTGTNKSCEVRYFENASYQTQYLVSMVDSTIVYEALDATYNYASDTLSVSAILKPKTGRIRFTGAKSTQVKLLGLSTYSSYSPTTNNFVSNKKTIALKVDSTSTPYVYGFFADTTDKRLSILTTNDAYTRVCGKDVLKKGESGYMAIPTQQNSLNWSIGLEFKVNGAKFKMIPVTGLASGFFLIGQSEVTEELYNKVNNKTSTNTSKLPISSITYSNINTWISKLNQLTSMTFSLPSKEQWQYAAKGGKVSQNFIYSGSDYAIDVAWYSANASTKQKVMTKAPNELGIYDMSGNVAEYTSTVYSGSNMYILGGSYCSSADYLKPTSITTYGSSSFIDAGFRLALVIK